MKTSRALLAVWAAAALLAVASPACTGSTPGNPGGGSPDGGGNGGGGGGGGGGGDGGPDGGSGNGSDGGSVLACVLPGASCVSGMPCCSGICDGTVCAVAEFCQANGQSCTTNTDCCLNSCVNGTCSDQICKDVGKSCGTGQECCTGTCTGGTCATLPGGSCNVIGQTCSTGSDCCSTNCQGGFCARAYSCQAVDDICRSDDECCGHACSANDGGVGHCLEVTGGGGGNCTQAGEPCSNGSNCCSRFCTDPGSGVTVCQAAEGCRLTGTWCTDTASCCGGGDPTSQVECNSGTCDNGNACAPSGNICGAPVVPLPDGGFGSINANQDCCNGKISNGGVITSGKDVCKIDGSGIPRCFGGISQSCPTGYTGEPGCCVAQGAECNFKDECCGGAPCLPGSDGKLRCTVSSCKSLGTTCNPQASECCSGTDCRPSDNGYVCQTSIPDVGDAGTPDAGTPDAGACNANGSFCAVNADCCSDRCIGDGTRTCQAPLTCQPQGSVCTSTADCCSGYSCSIPNGSTTGTCQTSSCTGAGQACTVNDECCTGLSCLDSTNYYCSGTGDCACRATLN